MTSRAILRAPSPAKRVTFAAVPTFLPAIPFYPQPKSWVFRPAKPSTSALPKQPPPKSTARQPSAKPSAPKTTAPKSAKSTVSKSAPSKSPAAKPPPPKSTAKSAAKPPPTTVSVKDQASKEPVLPPLTLPPPPPASESIIQSSTPRKCREAKGESDVTERRISHRSNNTRSCRCSRRTTEGRKSRQSSIRKRLRRRSKSRLARVQCTLVRYLGSDLRPVILAMDARLLYRVYKSVRKAMGRRVRRGLRQRLIDEERRYGEGGKQRVVNRFVRKEGGGGGKRAVVKAVMRRARRRGVVQG